MYLHKLSALCVCSLNLPFFHLNLLGHLARAEDVRLTVQLCMGVYWVPAQDNRGIKEVKFSMSRTVKLTDYGDVAGSSSSSLHSQLPYLNIASMVTNI